MYSTTHYEKRRYVGAGSYGDINVIFKILIYAYLSIGQFRFLFNKIFSQF
jgi:hypothetical protein